MDRLLDLNPPWDAEEEGRAARAEADLARRIGAGDGVAWEAFFTRFGDWTYRFAYRHLGGSRADAEDLCSDILLTAARSLPTFDSRRGTLDGWMLTLARRRLSRFCRQRRRQLPAVPDSARAAEESADAFALPAEASLTREVINCALAALPERQASALIGKYVQGQSVEELARTMNTSPKAVESLLSRARVAFRKVFTALVQDREGGETHG